MEKEIRKFIREELLVNKSVAWDNETDIISTGLIDSLATVRLLVFIEDKYNLSLDDSLDLDNFKSVNSIVSLVKRKLNT